MGPFPPAGPEWMWAPTTLVMSSTSIVYVTVVPSKMYCTLPLAEVLRAGTSFAGDSVASKPSIPSVPLVHPAEKKPTNEHKAPAEARANALRRITHLPVAKTGLPARGMGSNGPTLSHRATPVPVRKPLPCQARGAPDVTRAVRPYGFCGEWRAGGPGKGGTGGSLKPPLALDRAGARVSSALPRGIALRAPRLQV